MVLWALGSINKLVDIEDFEISNLSLGRNYLQTILLKGASIEKKCLLFWYHFDLFWTINHVLLHVMR